MDPGESLTHLPKLDDTVDCLPINGTRKLGI
jgi:hypothetical protein